MSLLTNIIRNKPAIGSIFFSYKRSDPVHERKIERVYQKLSDANLPLFRDKKDIPYGKNWKDTLEEALNDCVCGIALFTEASHQSDYIEFEVKMLLRMNKLIPIKIDSTPLIWGAEHIQGPDLSSWDGETDHEDWAKLVQELKQSVSRKVTGPVGDEPLPITPGEVDEIGGVHTIGNREYQPDLEHSYFRDAADLPLMTRIPHGRFIFAEPNGDQKSITLEDDFALGVTPITNRQWNRAAASGARNVYPVDISHADEEDCPVSRINWDEARAYIAWLNARSGLSSSNGYRLPSEVRLTYCMDSVNSSYTQKGNGIISDLPRVTDLRANSFGLKGMTGTVWHWVEDAYEDENEINGEYGEPHLNPTTSLKTVIGGSWRTTYMPSPHLRSGFDKTFARKDIGFRVMRRLNSIR